MSTFRHDSNSYGWCKLIKNIKDSAGKTLRILEYFQLVTSSLVKQQVVVTWNDKSATTTSVFPVKMNQLDITLVDTSKPDDLTTFYRLVRLKIIAKRIKNSLTTSSWQTLFSKRKHFTWAKSDDTAIYDGPTILRILISSVNPSTRVDVSDLKTSIRITKLNQFQYNVTYMYDNYDRLRDDK